MAANKLKSMQDSLLEYIVINFEEVFYDKLKGMFYKDYCNYVTDGAFEKLQVLKLIMMMIRSFNYL